MKRKLLTAILLSAMVMSFSACGKTKNAPETEKNPPSTEIVGTAEIPKTEVPQSTLKDDTLTTDKAVIKITGYEVIPPIENYDESSPILIITYDYTNNTDELSRPSDAWTDYLTATQETEATVEELDGFYGLSSLGSEYEELDEMGYTDVKPGATVQSVAAYVINYPSQPVILVAEDWKSEDKELGTKVIELTGSPSPKKDTGSPSPKKDNSEEVTEKETDTTKENTSEPTSAIPDDVRMQVDELNSKYDELLATANSISSGETAYTLETYTNFTLDYTEIVSAFGELSDTIDKYGDDVNEWDGYDIYMDVIRKNNELLIAMSKFPNDFSE